MEDVATAAGVSTATVSRCLNEPGKVSAKTRISVLEAVEKLHYTPNFGARAIAANRTGIFGVVIPTMENAIFARGIEAFQKELVANNATMLVASSDYDPKQEASQIRALVSRGADGLLLIGFQRDPSVYEFLAEREIPVVFAWATSEVAEYSFVGFDNKAASTAITNRALSAGHRSFAYVCAPQETNDRSKARLAGVKNAVQAAGLAPDAIRIIETEYSIENGSAAFNEIARNGPLPSAILCGNDVLAVGVIMAAKESGLKVPDDISVVGFDDIELATIVDPALTTVNVPHREMGKQAALALLALVKHPAMPIQVTLDTHIVTRSSLGPA